MRALSVAPAQHLASPYSVQELRDSERYYQGDARFEQAVNRTGLDFARLCHKHLLADEISVLSP